MKEHRDRRVAFFLFAAAVCFVLVPVADPELRWVPIFVGVVYIVLAVASALDARSRSKP
ncbi:MAG: hypothetical protein ACR2LQ_01365 [Acidimicrobiales bacterium]